MLLLLGTLLVQPADCFIHWRDVETGHEWGLNFTTASDARQFRDCCMVPYIFISLMGLTA